MGTGQSKRRMAVPAIILALSITGGDAGLEDVQVGMQIGIPAQGVLLIRLITAVEMGQLRMPVHTQLPVQTATNHSMVNQVPTLLVVLTTRIIPKMSTEISHATIQIATKLYHPMIQML